jgi:hypothetical protein
MGCVHGRVSIRRESTDGCVPSDQGIARGPVNAVDFVSGHITLDPLNLGAHFGEHSAGELRNVPKLSGFLAILHCSLNPYGINPLLRLACAIRGVNAIDNAKIAACKSMFFG